MVFEIIGAAAAAFILSGLGSLIVRFFARTFGAVRLSGGRHWHEGAVPLWGGVSVLLAFVVVTLLHPTLVPTPPIVAVFVGLTLFLVVGMVDDRRVLSWKTLLGVQLLAGFVLLAGGVRLWYINGFFGDAVRLDAVMVPLPDFFCVPEGCGLPLLGSLAVIAWVIAVTNAVNWLDGSDGVAASSALFVFVTLTILALTPDVFQPPLAILSATAAGAVLGFLLFNLPRAKLFLGSAGSFGIGFLIAALAVIAGAKLATVAMVLLLPAADALSVLLARWRAGVPLTRGDTRHLHHVLKLRGWSAWRIVLLHLGVSAFFGLLAVFVPRPWKLFLLAGGFVFLMFRLIRLKAVSR